MEKKYSDSQRLFNTVIQGGFCIGCGACASLEKSSIKMELDDSYRFQAVIGSENKSDQEEISALSICPFADESLNEDEIGKKILSEGNLKNDKLGYIKNTYAGYVNEDDYRKNGSSGGIVTWLLVKLFKKGLIDGVAHVHAIKPTGEDPRLFKYFLSKTIDEIKNGAKSRYYPVELSEVISQIKNRPGKYAIVGLPCFIKAVRLLMLNDEVLAKRIKFCIGLICGHLKSGNFANMWAWQVGINPSNLKNIDFRTKLKGYGANDYGITATGEIDGKTIVKKSPPLSQLFGSNWGWGFFKYKACDYCDDVVAETADVTIGDAWLPKYIKDSKGTNIVIVRDSSIQKLIQEGIDSTQLTLDRLTPEEVIDSQSSGFFHRREGLSYRLYLMDKSKKWRPQKRIKAAGNSVNRKIKKRQIFRILMAEKSHVAYNNAFNENSFQLFKTEMQPLLTEYQKLYRISFYKKIKNKIIRHLNR